MRAIKIGCVLFDSDSNNCVALEKLVCEKTGRCSFFCTEENALTSYRKYCEIMRRKPKKVQRRLAKIYHSGKMMWNKF